MTRPTNWLSVDEHSAVLLRRISRFSWIRSMSCTWFRTRSSNTPEGDNAGAGGTQGQRNLVAELPRPKLGIIGQRSQGDFFSPPRQSMSSGETMEKRERGFAMLPGAIEMQRLLHTWHRWHVEISQGVSSEVNLRKRERRETEEIETSAGRSGEGEFASSRVLLVPSSLFLRN